MSKLRYLFPSTLHQVIFLDPQNFFLLNLEALSASLFLLIKEHLKMHVNLQSPYLNEAV